MRIAFFSDVHSNIIFFREILRKIIELKPDKIISLGDNIGYFKYDYRIFKYIQKYNVLTITGNHEKMLIENKYDNYKDQVCRISESRNLMSNSVLNFVKGLKENLVLFTEKRKILCVHGGPDDFVEQYIYPNNDIEKYKKIDFDIIVMGHTHIPMIRYTDNGKVFINPGSCGLPRDYGNSPSFCFLDVESMKAKIYRLNLSADDVINKNEYLHQSVINCLKR